MPEHSSAHVGKKSGKTAFRPDPLPQPCRGVPPIHERLLTLQRALGNQAVHRLITAGRRSLRPPVADGGADITIGAPDDRQEQAADRTADRVMGMEKGEAPGEIRAGGGHSPDGGRISGLGAGIPLPSSGRSFFEPRFGRDLSRVRLHTDPAASDAARLLRARAFAVGPHIAFGRGEYDPAGTRGRRLLAHELAHVVQHQAAGSPPGILRRKPDDDAPSRKGRTPSRCPGTSRPKQNWTGMPRS